MIYDLIIKEEANNEIIESYLYYESKSEGLGDKFEIQLGIYLTESPNILIIIR